jgi:cardiolipin synthase A/B
MTSPASRRLPARPRSRPSLWRAVKKRRRLQTTLARNRTPKGRVELATHLRRLVWLWWLWAAVAIYYAIEHRWGWAIGTGLLATFAYLLQPQSEAPRYGLDHDLPVRDRSFLSTLAGATKAPYVPGNTFEVLHNGDAFYPRMLADIRAARVSVAIEAYIYWAGEIGAEFAEALAGRAHSGVRVTILLDSVGAADIGSGILDTLHGGGCEVAWYNPLSLRRLSEYNNRTHRKSLIVDGRIAYTGGAGIADHWRGQARGPEEWRDLQVRFEGPAVAGLQSGFAHNWQETTGEVVHGAAYYPGVAAKGPYPVQVVLSSPEVGASDVQTMYYLAIAGAERSIVIANPYFVPDAVAIDLLVGARRRGVSVRVMVSGVRNDNWLARQNSVRRYGPLLEAGVEILEYNRSMLHHKVMVVDSAWMTVGTANFDNRSFAHNQESNLCLFDEEQARAFEDRFMDDTKACATITEDQWRRRGWLNRMQETIAFIMEEQV